MRATNPSSASTKTIIELLRFEAIPQAVATLDPASAETYRRAKTNLDARIDGIRSRRNRGCLRPSAVRQLFYDFCNKRSAKWRALRPLIPDPEKVETLLARYKRPQRKL